MNSSNHYHVDSTVKYRVGVPPRTEEPNSKERHWKPHCPLGHVCNHVYMEEESIGRIFASVLPCFGGLAWCEILEKKRWFYTNCRGWGNICVFFFYDPRYFSPAKRLDFWLVTRGYPILTRRTNYRGSYMAAHIVPNNARSENQSQNFGEQTQGSNKLRHHLDGIRKHVSNSSMENLFPMRRKFHPLNKNALK